MGRVSFKPGNILNPVPVVMVSVKDKSDSDKNSHGTNIITVAWAGTICSDPAMVSISVRPNRYSYHLLEEAGEFVINLVTKDLVKACDYCGVKSGRDTDKISDMGLEMVQVDNVTTLGIKQSPVNIGCRIVEKKELGSHAIFMAEVIGVCVDDEYMNDNGRFDLNGLGLVAYSHGEYFLLGEKLGKFGFSVQKKKPHRRKKK